ncbi:hypothetical protein [Akkermansia sp.]|uniref:hypothetical protein n=1 Tax=Akkermansia sp. TaxID=1872421 RepID=UPI0025C20D5F|nr:hypothetical protein [Akkermansia sp.]MCC8149088.1 hypothetical protein [Akkermansia sp.]
MLIHIIYDRQKEAEAKFGPLAGVIRFVGPKSDRWSYRESMRLDKLPEEQAKVYLALASSIQAKGEDWQASQVWVEMEGKDKVSLRIEARQDGTGALRTFTPDDDPSLLISDPAAVAFFDYFMQA